MKAREIIRAKLNDAAKKFDTARAAIFINMKNDAENQIKDAINRQIVATLDFYQSRNWGPIFTANFKNPLGFDLVVMINESTDMIFCKSLLNCDRQTAN